jgi:L-threonylcarbamoyladenylate synthase
MPCVDAQRAMTEIGQDILYAAELLRLGETVAIPTETVYGLAGNALDERAVAKIFSAKNRPSFDPLIVHVAKVEDIEKWVKNVPKKARLLAAAFMPGPLTLVLPKADAIPDIVTSGHSTVGIRVPAHPLSAQLLSLLDFPLAAPSANPFGYVSPTSAQHVQHQLGGKISYILDGGPCSVGLESTIVAFDQETPVILRLGGLSIESICQTLGLKEIEVRQSSSRPNAPGMLDSHYAPEKKLILGKLNEMTRQYSRNEAVVLCLKDEGWRKKGYTVYELSPSGNLEEAARNLFHFLREMDQLKEPLILSERMPEHSLGRAINDRLQRASFQAGH